MENPVAGSDGLSLKSDRSMGRYMEFNSEAPCDHPRESPEGRASERTQLDAIFMILQENKITIVKTELRSLLRPFDSDPPEWFEREEDEEQTSRGHFLKISLDFLRRKKQEQLAEHLLYGENLGVCCQNLKRILQQRFTCVSEGTAKPGNPTLLNQIYTELFITGGLTGITQEHEVQLIETTCRRPATPECTTNKKGQTRIDLTDTAHRSFRKETNEKDIMLTEPQIRTVLTQGVAGIGKTVLTQKFCLDWAEGKTNQDLQLLFPFTFRELNVLRDTQFSLVELLHHFFSPSKHLCSFQQLQVLFIFDGLDECRLPLDFRQTRVLTDPTESSFVHVLLVNLIRGSLLPSARLWITTRPAATNQIPAECVSMVTEVRGFTDLQKEQYFRKSFKNEQQVTVVISHIKSIHSLHIMSHMPIFCWILSTVLHHVIQNGITHQLPQTLTEIYIHFLVVQAKVKGIKYNSCSETDSPWTPETREMVLSLGKLAFEQLQKGNLIFYESDLSECGLNAEEASVYSGVFTQVFREEPGLYQDKVYCFLHLSVQEFLAALHVYLTFIVSGVNLLSWGKIPISPKSIVKIKSQQLVEFLQSAVDQALKSPNGHLDLFLRFLLGLSLSVNQCLLQGLLPQTVVSSQTIKKTVEYIKTRIHEKQEAERSINLFHCLNELRDCSLVKQIHQNITSPLPKL
ncbi:protein NLRC3-like [Boleophthalmus pectinirostris]|uniref:protein NLRC3-like n=1 Tax=Boleophthalmus pectinirostris TaxID=150288 RepID=UPI00242E99FF|nr:protein NLRC3-like [Boleophthalmus pectinirostris]